jgi:polysaccharide biosynthesis transport protein
VMNDESLRTAAQHTDLYPELRGNPGAIAWQLRKSVRLKMITSKILDPESSREREVISGFAVNFESRNPALALAGATWFTNAYLAANRENHTQRAQGASNFLAAEADRYRKSIVEDEAKLADFKQKNYGRLPELTNINMNMMDNSQRDLEGIEMQIQSLRQNRIFLAQQYVQAQATSPEAERIPELEAELRDKLQIYDDNHPDVIALRKQIEALKTSGTGGMSLRAQLDSQRSTLAQARLRYSDDHPDVKNILQKIKSLEARIAAGEKADDNPASHSPVAVQLQTQLNAIDTQIAGLVAREAEERGKVAALEGRLVATPQVERAYKELTRDLDLAHVKYDELQKRQMDAEVDAAAIAGGAADEFRIVKMPVRPSAPSGPLRIAIALFGLIAAGIVALAGLMIADTIDSTVRGSRDVRNILGVSPIAMVPNILSAEVQRHRRTQFAGWAGALFVGAAAMFVAIRLWY